MGALARARAKDPRWLTTLGGSPPPPFDDGLDLPWCALCLRRENDHDDDEANGETLSLGDTSACFTGTHLFCVRCIDVCGGSILTQDKRCPLCRLSANAHGMNAFNKIVQESEPLKLPKPAVAFAGAKRLMLRDTISNDDRCELAVAIAADRCKELRESMRPKPGTETPPKEWKEHENETETETQPYDPSDVAATLVRFVAALPTESDLPDGLSENMAVVSNSSALLGLGLGAEIDQYKSVVRFNEYARAGLENFEKDVGGRTTLHVVSEQVIGGFLTDPAMLNSLRETPMTLWMPPLAWGNSRSYTRYVRLLLSARADDGLDLTSAQRKRVVVLRPCVSFSIWKYFRPSCTTSCTVGFGNDSGDEDLHDDDDLDDEHEHANFSEHSNTHDRPTTGTTGFKFFLLAMGISENVALFGFEDDPRNKVDKRGGHFFNPKHSQEDAYDIAWERKEMRRYEANECVRLVPSHK
jgi:hypothetical protein